VGKLRVNAFAVSLDGYSAGPGQTLDNPMGRDGMKLHQWVFPTRSFNVMFGKETGETGIDDDFARRGAEGLGAWILGRNMFGPIRGPWPDEDWKGWWGPNPPYHVPVFVLTHFARAPLVMEGGTTFHFVTGGAEEALTRARAAAEGKDIRVGGGATTIQAYLRARLIDEMHLAVAPVLLGSGERLFEGLEMNALGYEVAERKPGERATHYVIRRV
jgi:dihydrofolate reductase